MMLRFPPLLAEIRLVEIRHYYNVELPDKPPPHACSLKNTLKTSDVKASPHIPWTNYCS